MSTKTLMTRAIAFAREIKELTGCTPCELREVIPYLMPCHMGEALTDYTVHLGGSDWRFISMEHGVIEEIMTEELEADPYILGCFNASFLSGITGVPEVIIKAAQDGEQFEVIGQWLIDEDHVRDTSGPAHYGGIVPNYIQSDGPGHHFAHYDGETHELPSEGFYAFNVG